MKLHDRIYDYLYHHPKLQPDRPFWEGVNEGMCGDNLLGNIFYPLWASTDCSCCAFFRGFYLATILFILASVIDHVI